MEKNKRKFFIGKFPGKQGRKWEQERLLETNAREIHRGTNARKAKRALGVLLAAALVFQTLPFGSAAASASEGRGGLCEHHRSHTPDCGYREAEPGAECTHEHTEDCYKTVEDCIHEHTESCYPADTVSESEGAPADVGERQPTECSHSCSEESGCITKELDCRHEHDGSCGYTEGMPGSPCTFVCEICNGGTPEDDGNDSETGGETKEPDQEAEEKPDDGQEECICEKPCKEDSINQECPVCGAEDADLSECKGKDAEEDTQKPEDTGICKHHQAHDESCGYQPASEDGEGSPCTYDCRICPIEELIAALPEVGSITEENGSEVRAQLDQILALFAELTGEEQEQLDLSRCYELQEALDGANAPDPAAEEDGPAQIKMEVKGVTTYLTGDQLKEALGANQNKGATFTLLDDVKLPDGVSLFTHAGGDITLDCGSYTLSGNCESSALVYVNRDSLTLKGGTLKNTDPTGCCVAVSSKFGQFRMEGGTLLPEGGSGHAIEVYGSVTVTGGSVGESGKGLNLYSSGTATLSGGTFGDIHAENGLSSILAEGYAFCRDGKPVALTLDQKDIEGPVAVVKCTHPDTTAPQDKGDGTHSLSACLACGKSDGAEAHDWTENRLTCTVCGAAAVARMEPDGTLLTEAQLEATLNTVNGIYTLTLLRDLERSERLVVGQYVTCTLDLNGHTIRMTGSGMAIYTYGDSNVTIRGTGEIISVNSNALTVLGTATLEGGTYSGGTAAIAIASQSSSLTLGDLLGHSGDTRYAYFDESGAPLTGVLGDQSLTGTVTVRECQHTGEGVCAYVHNENATTHQQTCLACGLAEAAADCAYSDDYGHDETNHWQTCTLCGGKKTEAHNWVHQCTSATGIIRRSCDKCEIETVVGTVSITPDFSVAYGETGSATLACTAELADGYSLEPADSADNCWVLMALSDGKSWNLGRELEVKLPADLPAGEYWYNASPRLSYQGDNTIVKCFNVVGKVTVTPAPLTVTGVTAENRAYNGSNSVKITGVTLDGVLNNDDVSVDLTGLTGTLSGSDAGTYTAVTLPRLTLTGAGAKNYTLTQPTGAVPASVTISKAPLTVTGVTIKTRPYKPTYHTAEVSGVTFTGLVNGETLALGEDYAAFGNYDDPNAGENKSATILVELKSSAKANNYTLPKDSSVNATGTITAIPIADKNVTLSPASAVYDGTEQKPTVTIAGLTEGADYTVSYTGDFTSAGTHTVTVTGKGNYEGTVTKTFTIEKAEQTDFAFAAVTKPYEKNGTFTLSTAGGGGNGAVLYRVPENNGVLMVNGDQATIIGVGTVTVTATKAESENYKAATATGTIRITKAPAPAITYPAVGSITYGQKLSDCTLTGGSTEYGTFAWENGSTIPAVDNTGYTVVFTASEETKKNYETITNTTKSVSVKVEKAAPAVSVTAAVSGSKDNRQAVITVNVAKAGAGAFPTGTVTFIDCTGGTETEIGTATLTGGSATCTWEGLQDKEYTVRAVYAGNNNYTEAESRELTFDAAKQDQQGFALDAIEAKTYGDAAVTLKTTGGNGSGAIRYESSDENVIRIEDGRAVITGAGTATITAIKAGDDRYNEASAGRTVTVAKKALTVRADSITVVRGDTMPPFTYKAPGLVNGDTFTADPAMTAGVQDTDTLGKYDIVISGGTLRNSESYNITYVNGILNIVERFYAVTVTDGTGSGEYAEGDTVTVTADERNGYTFTGWSSGDGVAFADSKAKTTTFAMPAKAVAVKANYTRNSSGGNTGGGSGGSGNHDGGGNSDGNENNGGQGSGNGNNGGNGNTPPQASVTPPADTGTNTNPGNKATPGTGTTPVNLGTGNTVRPGSGTGTPAQGTKQPFIKGEDGKIGWDVIRAEEEKAEEGSVINVDMNGSTVVPGDIFDSIKGKDITITFDMGNGILWSVDGKGITTDKAGDIDFSVKSGVKTVPVDIINNVTGESYSIQISLAYEGEFGFTAVLSIGLGRENAGYTASLYYYNESTGELEFICKDQIAEDGTVSLAFTHASDYVIAIDGDGEEGSSTIEALKTDIGNTPTEVADTGVKDNMWNRVWRIVAGIVIIILSLGIYFIVKRKKGEEG